MKNWLMVAVLFCAGFVVISSMRSGPSQPDGPSVEQASAKFPGGLEPYYSGCELPGAIPDCKRIMENAPRHEWPSSIVPLRNMPASGPTEEMKLAAIREQDVQLRDARDDEMWRSAVESQKKSERLAQTELERRAGVR
jgi:hypothetical protein